MASGSFKNACIRLNYVLVEKVGYLFWASPLG